MSDSVNKTILEGKKHIHFIGIGGSGMYPLAQILHSKGYYLTGSDNNSTETLDAVKAMGIPVFMGQASENIEGADLIVHTAAIMADNPELIAAKASGVPVLERSELLGIVTAKYQNAVCVSGTHGKTTTSSMLTQIFLEAGVDISCVIGGKLKAIGGSGRVGKSETLVCEACEYVDTFLKLFPDVSIILNIDDDHLDYFGSIENSIASFRKFAEKTTKALIVNGDDKNTMTAVDGLQGKDIITYGFGRSNDYYAEIKAVKGMTTDFELFYKGGLLGAATMYVPGKHNVLNAVAAIAAAIYCGVDFDSCVLGLQVFRGVVRRFEHIANCRGVTIVDDYAHHPKEVEVVLKVAKSLDFKRVWAVHQPFTYSRTARMKNEFAEALSIADKTVLTEIMGSREKNTYNIYAKDLAALIPDCEWFSTFDETVEFLAANVSEGDLVITLGCGDIYKVAKQLAQKLEK